MEDLFLIKPGKKYQKSFENYVLSYKETNDEYYFQKYKRALENYDEYLTSLNRSSQGIGLSPGEVITSTFWLVFKEDVVGVVRIRHKEIEFAGHIGYDIAPCYRKMGFGFQILKLALAKAKKLGISKIIITCNTENSYSRRIIEKNNGRLLETVFDEEENEHLYKYLIASSPDD